MTRMLRSIATVSWLLVLAGAPAQAPAQATAQALPAEPTGTVLERALTLQKSGGSDAALEFLMANREQAVSEPYAMTLLGTLLLDAGRGEESYAVLEPLSRVESAPPTLLFNTWRAASLVGLAEERADLLERAVARDPASPAARQLGLIRGNQGRLQEAYVLLVPWIRKQPADTQARIAAAHLAVELRRVPQAEELLSGLSLEIPHVRLLRGRILFLSDDPRAALEMLEVLGERQDLPPGLDRDRRLTMAHAYMAIGESGSAVDLLEGRQGGDPILTLVLSQAQSQSGDVNGALESISPVAAALLRDPAMLDPGLSVGLLLHYGRQLIATGAAEKAVEPLQLARELAPDNESVLQSLGQALAVSGRREEAQEVLESFRAAAEKQSTKANLLSEIERDREDPTGRQLREALELLASGRGSEALELAQSERQMAPRDPRVPIVESKILRQLGRLEEALRVAQEAVELAPSQPDPYHQRGVVLLSMNRDAEAEADFRRSLEIDPDHQAAADALAGLDGRD